MTFFLLTDRSYLSLDWEPEMKKKYFDETLVEVKPTSGDILWYRDPVLIQLSSWCSFFKYTQCTTSAVCHAVTTYGNVTQPGAAGGLGLVLKRSLI